MVRSDLSHGGSRFLPFSHDLALHGTLIPYKVSSHSCLLVAVQKDILITLKRLKKMVSVSVPLPMGFSYPKQLDSAVVYTVQNFFSEIRIISRYHRPSFANLDQSNLDVSRSSPIVKSNCHLRRSSHSMASSLPKPCILGFSHVGAQK
jgi:hypothetical protein